MNNIILNALYQEIDFLTKTKENVVIAIDGRAAAGKTSFAKLISEKFSAVTVHMDDFFLPTELRVEERLSQPGGNIHYERFSAEVLPYLKADHSFSYRRFDCSTLNYGETVYIPENNLVVVEGAYSMHPRFGTYYDLALFMDIDKAAQEKRIESRNGLSGLKKFTERWIPMEEKYLEACDIINKCDHIIEY